MHMGMPLGLLLSFRCEIRHRDPIKIAMRSTSFPVRNTRSDGEMRHRSCLSTVSSPPGHLARLARRLCHQLRLPSSTSPSNHCLNVIPPVQTHTPDSLVCLAVLMYLIGSTGMPRFPPAEPGGISIAHTYYLVLVSSGAVLGMVLVARSPETSNQACGYG
jgi:hypothetical protein